MLENYRITYRGLVASLEGVGLSWSPPDQFPLHRAIVAHDFEEAKQLLEKDKENAHLNSQVYGVNKNLAIFRDTPIHLLIKVLRTSPYPGALLELLEIMLQRPVNLYLTNKDGITVEEAVESNQEARDILNKVRKLKGNNYAEVYQEKQIDSEVKDKVKPK